jgi:hypothetical protein
MLVSGGTVLASLVVAPQRRERHNMGRRITLHHLEEVLVRRENVPAVALCTGDHSGIG